MELKLLFSYIAKIVDIFGVPASLIYKVKSHDISSVPYPFKKTTIFISSVVHWEEWLEYECGTISWYHPESFGGNYRSSSLKVFHSGDIVTQQIVEPFNPEIRDVTGLSSSKSGGDYCELDDFAKDNCTWQLGEQSLSQLNICLDHERIEKNKHIFSSFSWLPEQLFWCNSGGSHHFSAARSIVKRLGSAVTLYGQLHRYVIDKDSVSGLISDWHLIVIDTNYLVERITVILENCSVSYGLSALPRQEGVSDTLKVLWLKKNDVRQNFIGGFLVKNNYHYLNDDLIKLIKF